MKSEILFLGVTAVVSLTLAADSPTPVATPTAPKPTEQPQLPVPTAWTGNGCSILTVSETPKSTGILVISSHPHSPADRDWPANHDWTAFPLPHRLPFGVRSWGSASVVYYGFGYFSMPLSFWPTVSLLCILPLGACAGSALLFRRRYENAA